MNEVHPVPPIELEQMEPVPNRVIAVINQLIKKNWNGTSAIVRVNEALGLIYLLTNYSSEVVERNQWINGIKSKYSEAGYNVTEFGSEGTRCLEFKTT